MTARILIVDSIATNRIVLKVKMTAAQFAVDACATRAEAEDVIAEHHPDLVLLNLSDPDDDRHGFCKTLRNLPGSASIAIIAVGVADNAQARFAALDAGADDVLPHPINDTLLMARIRSLLRVRSVGQELVLRDSTSRALGFEEAATHFQAAAHVALVSSQIEEPAQWLCAFRAKSAHKTRLLEPSGLLGTTDLRPVPDLFVLDATQGNLQQSGFLNLISDLRSRSETRLAAQLVVLGPDQAELAAMCLDLGADDVVSANAEPNEMNHRAHVLISRKQQHDRLRDTVRSGLHAAITDPLTGLYNRRYAVPYLNRMAEESTKLERPFAVMMIDIDHFKAVNDTYGHAAGDTILVQLSDRLRENLRAIDLVARMGGEEFLVAMPRTSVRRAKLAADRLRRLVNKTPFDYAHGKSVAVTVSVGVAVNGIPGHDVLDREVMCNLADQALYEAKAAGRDQVAMCGSAA